MNFEHRLRRRRDLALIEAQSLVTLHRIEPGVLEQLESQNEARRRSLSQPIAEAQSLMAGFGISLEEVLDDGSGDSHRVTHRHPTTGETWDGRGSQPDWLRQALLREGYRPSELRVAAP